MLKDLTRVLLVAAAALWLACCSSTASLTGAPAGASDPEQVAGSNAMAEAPQKASLEVPSPDPTPSGQRVEAPRIIDPNSDLALGKKAYRDGDFGLSEQHFRRAAELHPNNVEVWIGLAAAYDRLRRFDFADRAYGQATKLAGPSVEILNNQGYSYILRGDYSAARAKLRAADARSPNNPYVQSNLRILADSARGARTGE